MGQNTALICEFNPLHNGHRAIISYIKERGDTVVAVMSGNFTQRSEAAVFEKYKRAEAALRCGVDAVLELPFPWCCGGAEFFAHGAVSVATGLGLSNFVFGSETGDTSHVLRAADHLSSDSFRESLSKLDTDSLGAAAAYELALERFGIKLGSNDKLACEYVRAAARISPHSDFTAYKRMTDPETYRSATQIREMLADGEDVSRFVPEEALCALGNTVDVHSRRLEEILFGFFRLYDAPVSEAFDASGGVTQRLMNAAREASSPGEFFAKAATKKYTHSRLRRAALFTFLGVSEDALRFVPEFTVLLGANEKGRAFLADARRSKSIALLTKPSDTASLNERGTAQYKLWAKADELYSLCRTEDSAAGEFLRRSPVIV